MNGSAENRASGASEKPGPLNAGLDLATARRMLPLVRRIIWDLLASQRRLAQLLPEQNRLDRQRHQLAWPERSRRYQIRDEIGDQEQYLQDALAELEVLGLELLNPQEGRVGFPTRINGRRAYFSWRPDQETVRHWHYAGEKTLHSIPPSWLETPALNSRADS